MRLLFTICVVSLLSVTSVWAQEPVDLDMVSKIREEGFERSEVMDSLRVLSDEIGPRLTASPGMRTASKWSAERLQAWGVDEVYLEGFEFGRGWSMIRSEIHMTSPRKTQLHGLPVEWYPGTGGVVEGEVVHAILSSADDFPQWEGKLKGKMVLIDEVAPPSKRDSKNYSSFTNAELDEIARPKEPEENDSPDEVWAEDLNFRQERNAFLVREGALVSVRNNGRADMSINNTAYQYHAGMTPGIPSVVLATEHYERLIRLAAKEHIVRLSVEVEARYYDDDHKGYNTIAEIPGKEPNPEIVMAGAHIDSHAVGDGASDNAAGVAVVMEAMRILKALDVQTTRSIRIGLWSGEEQDIYGSAQHVRQNFGSYPRKTDDIYKYVGDLGAADLSKPFVKRSDYDRFSVYFNVDGGAGRIRGIYAEGNAAASQIFESWLLPFHDLGATHVTLNHTGNTDHESFRLIGLPGYQFMQDRSGGNGGAHTQFDMYDEIYAEDLQQASVVLASFLYHAATRDDRMPRMPENVFTIVEKPSAMKEADRLGIWYPASDFEPLGLYLPPDHTIEVNVENIRGSSQPSLLVGTYSRYKAEDEPNVYELVDGSNTISDSQGGLLYLKFVTEDTPSSEAKVTVDGGDPIPSYVLGESTHEGWLQDLATMSYEDVQFISNKTMVVVSKATALAYKDEDQDSMLETLDKVWEIQDYISGIDGSSDLHKTNVHKILITELTEKDLDFGLAAEEHRILVPTKALNNIMDPAHASSAAWGLWHEMGHHHQALNWDWDEVDEVTVNIYSLACLYALDGTISWLKGKEVWDVVAEYLKSPIAERDFNQDQTIRGNGRLAMFRQLWMAFGDEFYIKVHQLAREDNAKPDRRVKPRYESTGDEQMAHFMLLSSEASGYNLKEFFTQWGFKLPKADFDALDVLNLPTPTIDLLALRE